MSKSSTKSIVSPNAAHKAWETRRQNERSEIARAAAFKAHTTMRIDRAIRARLRREEGV